jgi:hypothetical protein
MYQFSRAMYRELSDEIVEGPNSSQHLVNHERVLRACETAVERLATDRRYFARPPLTLFREIRWFFPLSSQSRVLWVTERYLSLAAEFVRNLPTNGLDVHGNPLQCRATTRRGTPCQRMPLPHNGYCPSHQHLAETEEQPAPLAA